METYLAWIVANFNTFITALLAIIGGFSIIAKLTPTQTDDAVIAKIVAVLDFFALNKQRNP